MGEIIGIKTIYFQEIKNKKQKNYIFVLTLNLTKAIIYLIF